MKENNTSVLEECPLCGAKGTVAPSVRRFVGSYNRVPIEVDAVEGLTCEACGEGFFTHEQSREVSRKVKQAAREKLSILSPERIVEIRRKAKLSQEDLEGLLGLGEKVVTRWETGRVVPTKAADFVLRLLERRPEIIQDLREIRAEARGSQVANGF